MHKSPNPDAMLVERSLAGDGEAFREIIERYQNLICSITFSISGNFSHSQDLAQETFVLAWKNLVQLKDRSRLKAWLCSIARNVSSRSIQKLKPLLEAEPLPSEAPDASISPPESAARAEEEQVVWSALEKMPESYREPLVLFYREDQSIQNVAQALDLTEEAVKQRLSRGRAMLKDEVAAFVERALTSSKPGKTFAASVLGAAVGLGGVSSASGAMISGAKAYGAIKTAGILAGFGVVGTLTGSTWGLIGGLLGGLGGLAGGLLGIFVPRMIAMKIARSDDERALIRFHTKRLAWLAIGFTAFQVAMLPLWMALRTGSKNLLLISLCLSLVSTVIFSIWTQIWTTQFARQLRKLREIKMPKGPSVQTDYELEFARRLQLNPAGYEYISRWRVLGIPLIHVSLQVVSADRKPARGWIAVGHRPIGLIAFGDRAVGLVAAGGISLGAVSAGGLSVGVLAFGGLAIGGWALGGLALAWQGAVGGAAIAIHAAWGGLAIAFDYSAGGLAIGKEANSPAARQFFNHARISPERIKAWEAKFHLYFWPLLIAWVAFVWILLRRKK